MPYSDVVGYQCCLHLQGDDGGSWVLQNIGILPLHYMASQIRRPQWNLIIFFYLYLARFWLHSYW